MDVSITSRHIEITDEIRQYAEEKFRKAERIFHGVQKIEVILKTEDRKVHCEAIVHAKNRPHMVIDVARDDKHEAIDVAIDKCERQLRRAKEKAKSHRRKGESTASLPSPEPASAEEDETELAES